MRPAKGTKKPAAALQKQSSNYPIKQRLAASTQCRSPPPPPPPGSSWAPQRPRHSAPRKLQDAATQQQRANPPRHASARAGSPTCTTTGQCTKSYSNSDSGQRRRAAPPAAAGARPPRCRYRRLGTEAAAGARPPARARRRAAAHPLPHMRTLHGSCGQDARADQQPKLTRRAPLSRRCGWAHGPGIVVVVITIDIIIIIIMKQGCSVFLRESGTRPVHLEAATTLQRARPGAGALAWAGHWL